jgi:hypothetical protein
VEPASPELSALLIRCPAAEPAVSPHRLRLDRAAAFGVPAHLTVCFPFKPVAQLTAADHDELANAFAQVPVFALRGDWTGWFGETMLHVVPEPVEPVLELIRLVGRLFPNHPIYGGEIDDIVPHLTIGIGDPADLLAVERSVASALPFEQEVSEVELWAGPPLDGPVGAGWRSVRAYPLG